jgi:hypothetical protein
MLSMRQHSQCRRAQRRSSGRPCPHEQSSRELTGNRQERQGAASVSKSCQDVARARSLEYAPIRTFASSAPPRAKDSHASSKKRDEPDEPPRTLGQFGEHERVPHAVRAREVHQRERLKCRRRHGVVLLRIYPVNDISISTADSTRAWAGMRSVSCTMSFSIATSAIAPTYPSSPASSPPTPAKKCCGSRSSSAASRAGSLSRVAEKNSSFWHKDSRRSVWSVPRNRSSAICIQQSRGKEGEKDESNCIRVWKRRT